MKRLAAIASVVMVMGSTPALADDDLDLNQEMEKAGEALRDSLSTLMNLIQKAVKGVPQYEAPEILDNGDIIIRRKNAEDIPHEDHVET